MCQLTGSNAALTTVLYCSYCTLKSLVQENTSVTACAYFQMSSSFPFLDVYIKDVKKITGVYLSGNGLRA